MRQVYFDLFSGVAGDMLVAGLLDAGADPHVLERALGGLPVDFQWRLQREQRQHISGLRFVVEAASAAAPRHLAELLEILRQAELTPRARAWAEACLQELAAAEGRCHDLPPSAVHFHELGAVDTLVDVSAACALLDALAPDALWASPVAVGSGFVDCAHGRMPVPAPGTLELLRGMPLCGEELQGERATPTGVALLRAWNVQFGSRPPAVTERVGHGLGRRETTDVPNLLRVRLEQAEGAGERLVELRTLVDDQSGEVIGAALEALRAAGALEAYAVPALGKKGRPAFEICVHGPAALQAELEELVFRHLGTLGLRVQAVVRSRRPRAVEERDTPLGKLPFKVRLDPGGTRAAKPEFDALRERAAERGQTPREGLRQLGQESSPPRTLDG